MLYIDFKKAFFYDCIHCQSLVCALDKFGFSLKTINLIKTYNSILPRL